VRDTSDADEEFVHSVNARRRNNEVELESSVDDMLDVFDDVQDATAGSATTERNPSTPNSLSGLGKTIQGPSDEEVGVGSGVFDCSTHKFGRVRENDDVRVIDWLRVLKDPLGPFKQDTREMIDFVLE
jgi:hypothetical protein